MNKWLDKEIISATRTIASAYTADFGTGSGLACFKKTLISFCLLFCVVFFIAVFWEWRWGGMWYFPGGHFK